MVNLNTLTSVSLFLRVAVVEHVTEVLVQDVGELRTQSVAAVARSAEPQPILLDLGETEPLVGVDLR
jgi:hypothetical protein